MATIRAGFPSRIAFVVLVVASLLATLAVFRSEGKQAWKEVQRDYRGMFRERVEQKIRTAEEQADAQAVEKWTRLLENAEDGRGPRIEQVFLPDAGVRDLCQTCHLAVENPLFRDAANPLRHHPPEILADHKPNRFGCTLCHHGQGVGLTVEKAHGYEENWPLPRVPARFVQGLCLGCHESPFGLKGAEKAEQGRALFVEHGCYGCHEARTTEDLPRMSTPFEGIGTKIYKPQWMYQWIKEPTSIRPRNRMPAFRLQDEEILHIVAYLNGEEKLPKDLASYRRRQASYSKGRDLFTEKGCVACHSVTRNEPCLTDRVPNLSDAGLKLSSRWIATWLEGPADLSPETAMPRLMLTEEERRDLTRYLKGLWPKEIEERLEQAPANVPEGGDAKEGKRLVQLMGCYGCHLVKDMERLPLSGVEVGEVAGKRLDELPFGSSDVPHTKWDWLFNKIKKPDIFETEDMPLKMPDYRLDEEEMEYLTVYYLHNADYDLPRSYLCKVDADTAALARGEWMLSHYNCRGCHQLEENAKPRVDAYIGRKSMVPPRLINQAERVQPQWFFQYLSKPVELRPWLEIRMPEFNWSYRDRETLISYFRLALDPALQGSVKVPYVSLPVREDYDPEVIEMGEYRVKTDKCMQCHPVSFDGGLPEGVKLEDLSINLMLSKSRLRFDWIKNFLRNPDRYAGQGTKMPYVYYTPDGVARMPDPEMWIEYASLFLMFMDKVPEMPEEKAIEEVRPGADVDWTQYE
jgi:mono/diheme cytochrome c family protein